MLSLSGLIPQSIAGQIQECIQYGTSILQYIICQICTLSKITKILFRQSFVLSGIANTGTALMYPSGLKQIYKPVWLISTLGTFTLVSHAKRYFVVHLFIYLALVFPKRQWWHQKARPA